MPRISGLLLWSLATWCIEANNRPGIRFEPEQSVYIVGERMTMRCVADRPSTVDTYTFYKDSVIISDRTSTSILTFSNLKLNDSGAYFCIYNTSNGEKSSESIEIKLEVFEQPDSPLLDVTPQRKVFIKDQSAVLRCQLPNTHVSVTEITLYKNGRETFESDNFGVLNYTKLQIMNTGNYSCTYTAIQSGRTLKSFFSFEQTLIVIDQPPTPRLRFAYSHQHQQVELACEVQNPSFSNVHGYRFYRNGVEIKSSFEVNHFTFNYTLNFDGCYFCRTYVKILEEVILSPKSFEQPLSLNVNDTILCQENMNKNILYSKQGLKFYGSILAGKLLVLFSLLAIFGVYLLLIQFRNQKPAAETQ
ncbi:uncharacterized protein [Pyxicephalus adspersus]|uniref:uncharacterized protein isoform X2 n=1 Tax=Pyxicephalus adspersus TaxID=30357 RepID=UPI003B59B611